MTTPTIICQDLTGAKYTSKPISATLTCPAPTATSNPTISSVFNANSNKISIDIIDTFYTSTECYDASTVTCTAVTTLADTSPYSYAVVGKKPFIIASAVTQSKTTTSKVRPTCVFKVGGTALPANNLQVKQSCNPVINSVNNNKQTVVMAAAGASITVLADATSMFLNVCKVPLTSCSLLYPQPSVDEVTLKTTAGAAGAPSTYAINSASATKGGYNSTYAAKCTWTPTD